MIKCCQAKDTKMAFTSFTWDLNLSMYTKHWRPWNT